jgi:hypothetical protein
MARKTLLNESEIRRFMKLANVKPVGQERLEEMYGMPPGARDEDDENVQDEDPAGKSLEEQEEEVEMDMAAEEEPMDMDKPAEEPMDEPEMDMDMGADVGMKKVDIGEFFSALEAALEDTLGQEVDIEGDDMEADEGGDDEAADMEMDMDMDAPEGDMDMGMDDEEPGMRDMMENEDEDLMEARVNRIAARVAQRLMAENKKASNIDALTERIFNRLANK